MSRVGLAALTLALATAASGAAPLAADYKDDYKAAVAAVEAKRYAEAVRLLQAAIQEKGEEKSGSFSRGYFPHYYLGVALSETGDCRRALDAWRTSESQGQVQKRGELVAELGSRRRRCQEKVTAADTAVGEAKDAVDTARKRFAGLDGVAAAPEMRGPWTEGGAESFQSRRQALERQLKAVDGSLEEAYVALDAGRLTAARDNAREIAREIDALESAARARLDALGKANAEAVAGLEDLEGSLRRILRSIEDLQPYPPELAKRVAESEAALAAAGAASPSAGPAALKKIEDDLTLAMSRVRRAAQRPPPALVEAVDAFLRGAYAEVVTALDGKRFDDPRATGHACLLRAAARHAAWALGDEGDTESLAAVTAEIVACGRLQPVPEPDARYYSPRFRELFRTSLAGSPAP